MYLSSIYFLFEFCFRIIKNRMLKLHPAHPSGLFSREGRSPSHISCKFHQIFVQSADLSLLPFFWSPSGTENTEESSRQIQARPTELSARGQAVCSHGKYRACHKYRSHYPHKQRNHKRRRCFGAIQFFDLLNAAVKISLQPGKLNFIRNTSFPAKIQGFSVPIFCPGSF